LEFPESPQAAPVPYKTCKFGHDRSIIEGTVLGGNINILALSLLPLEGFSRNSTTAKLLSCPTKRINFVPSGK
jgi:hypothetical protein